MEDWRQIPLGPGFDSILFFVRRYSVSSICSMFITLLL